MTDKPAMTMRQIREGLGHTVPPEGIPEPIVQPTKYSVNCLPEDGIDSSVFGITVEYRGAGRWAVILRSAYLGTDGEWSWGYAWEGGDREPVTDEDYASYQRGQDAWLDAHRFDEATAIRLAKEQAPLVTVNGYTVADGLRMAAKRKPRTP